MKTEVRKEHGDWIVFVDDNPQFGFVYKEEAEKVRNMIDALILAHADLKDWVEPHRGDDWVDTKSTDKIIAQIEQVLLTALSVFVIAVMRG